MKYIFLFCAFASAILLISFESSEFTYPNYFPKPVYNFSQNPLKKEVIQLGRRLFYDPILSADSSISCASCHSQYNAFAHVDHDLSHGIYDRIGKRNAPALMNLAWQELFMWDGAVNHLDMQALAPITHPNEMDNSLENVISRLRNNSTYRHYFFSAFNDSSIKTEHVLKALSQFELTFISANSKYDSVKKGLVSFTEKEQKGYEVFLQNCNACHTEPLFSSYSFSNNGLPLDSTLLDYGRVSISLQSADSGYFKIPTLRNLRYSFPYMHDGRFKTLSKVIQHYTSGINYSLHLPKELKKPLQLSSEQKVELMSFLFTLNDSSFVFNKQYSYLK